MNKPLLTKSKELLILHIQYQHTITKHTVTNRTTYKTINSFFLSMRVFLYIQLQKCRLKIFIF